jgi:hypothetical protein
LKTFAFEVVTNQLDNVPIIFDQQNSFHRHVSLLRLVSLAQL